MNDADGMSAERQPAGEEALSPPRSRPCCSRRSWRSSGGGAGRAKNRDQSAKKTALNAPGPKSNGIRHLPRHGERSCLFILRRSRHPKLPPGAISWSDLPAGRMALPATWCSRRHGERCSDPSMPCCPAAQSRCTVPATQSCCAMPIFALPAYDLIASIFHL